MCRGQECPRSGGGAAFLPPSHGALLRASAFDCVLSGGGRVYLGRGWEASASCRSSRNHLIRPCSSVPASCPLAQKQQSFPAPAHPGTPSSPPSPGFGLRPLRDLPHPRPKHQPGQSPLPYRDQALLPSEARSGCSGHRGSQPGRSRLCVPHIRFCGPQRAVFHIPGDIPGGHFLSPLFSRGQHFCGNGNAIRMQLICIIRANLRQAARCNADARGNILYMFSASGLICLLVSSHGSGWVETTALHMLQSAASGKRVCFRFGRDICIGCSAAEIG